MENQKNQNNKRNNQKKTNNIFRNPLIVFLALSLISTAILIGAAIGAAIGFGAAAYIDYKDDGQLFNGSVKWYDYLGATVLGGAIGAGISYALTYINSYLGTSFQLGSYMAASGELVAVTATGAEIATGLTALAGMGIMLSSTNRPGDNRKQNEQYREAMRRLGYSKKDWQWRYGHDHLPNVSLGFKDLLKFLEDLFSKFK